MKGDGIVLERHHRSATAVIVPALLGPRVEARADLLEQEITGVHKQLADFVSTHDYDIIEVP